MAVRKLRILAVENDPEWLELILLLFPDHLVKPIRYYADALPIVEAENMAYDAAIVDLNLIDPPASMPPGRRRRDMLGGELLVKLYEGHPATLRIALTGVPPGGPVLEGLVTRFHVDEFFMKDDLDLADLRRVVMESPAAKAAAQETAEPSVDAQVADQRYRLQAWADVRRAQLDLQLEGHQDDLRAAGRIAATGDGAVDEATMRSAVEQDKGQLAAVSTEYARVAEMLDEAQTTADVARATREIDRLMGAAPGPAAAS